MRVLVTGAAGFLGQYVCFALEQVGHEVIRLDKIPPMPRNARHPADVVASITEPLPVVDILNSDAVIHLAAMASPSFCDRNPGEAFKVNVQGTYNVLKLALESGAKKFVFSSSAHVYGISPKYLPTDETHPLQLLNTYTTTKILGEQLCQLFYENHGLSYTVLRLYNAYGPGQGPGYFIPDQIEKARIGNFTLQGGNITKDWVYVDDVADAFVRAVESAFVGPVNVGTGIETSLADIGRMIGTAYRVPFDAYVGANPTRMLCDNQRAKSVLGWVPKVSLEEGLDRTIKAYEKRPVLQKS